MTATARLLVDGASASVRIGADGAPRGADGSVLAAEAAHWLPAASGKVICVALNHRPHLERLQAAMHAPPYRAPPRSPVLFLKPPNTLAGHLAPLPAAPAPLYAGGALALVFGRPASRVAAAEALDYVGGYSVFNELTLAETDYFRPAVRAKCRDGSGALGPAVVPAAGIDPDALSVRTFVDGELRGELHTAELARGAAELIAALTAYMRFEPGDVLVTGFAERDIALARGQRVSVEIPGVGRLENTIATEAAWAAYRAREEG